MKITIIVDNHGNTAFHPEFGLSLLIQEKDLEYLFDTGAGVALYPNLFLLKKDLTSIKNVILSHGHTTIPADFVSFLREKSIAVPVFKRVISAATRMEQCIRSLCRKLLKRS